MWIGDHPIGDLLGPPADVRREWESAQRQAVIAAAKKWVGTPYQSNQACLGAGVDCGRILAEVYSQVVGPIPVPKNYSPQAMMHSSDEAYLAEIQKYAHEIPESQVKPGDLAVFKWGKTYCHAAIIVAWPTCVIHSASSGGRHQRGAVMYADISRQMVLGRLPRKFYSVWPVASG